MRMRGHWAVAVVVAAGLLGACATRPAGRAEGAPAPMPAPVASAAVAGAEPTPVLQPAVPNPTLKQRAATASRYYAMAGDAATAEADFRPDALPAGAMAVHAINVGQGDAFLVEFACGAVLIDAGYQNRTENKQRLADYLAWFFQQHRPDLDNTLSLAVVSHSHADHASGFPIVLGDPPGRVALAVSNVVDNGYDVTGGADEQVRLREASVDGYHPIQVRDIAWYEGVTSRVIDPVGSCPLESTDPLIRVLWGGWDYDPQADKNPNHHSVVVRIDFGQASFLFTGDLQVGESSKPGGLDSLLEEYAGDMSAFDVDVLKVAHHGAENGTNEALLQAVRPCIAMLGVGDPTQRGPGTAHDHGHPRTATMRLLGSDALGVSGRRPRVSVQAAPAGDAAFSAVAVDRAVFGTAWDGHYVVYGFKDGRYRVTTETTGLEAHAVECR